MFGGRKRRLLIFAVGESSFSPLNAVTPRGWDGWWQQQGQWVVDPGPRGLGASVLFVHLFCVPPPVILTRVESPVKLAAPREGPVRGFWLSRPPSNLALPAALPTPVSFLLHRPERVTALFPRAPHGGP